MRHLPQNKANVNLNAAARLLRLFFFCFLLFLLFVFNTSAEYRSAGAKDAGRYFCLPMSNREGFLASSSICAVSMTTLATSYLPKDIGSRALLYWAWSPMCRKL